MRYIGTFENEFITLNALGLLPSMQKFVKQAEQQKSEDPAPKQAGNFRHFLKFMADNETYLVSTDHPQLEDHISDMDLLKAIISGQ